MKRINYLIIIAVLIVVGAGSYYLLRAPSFSAEDFSNEDPPVLQNSSFPQTELDLRLQEVREREPAREGEDPLEAAADAAGDYLQAGLYAEALRISDAFAGEFSGDPGYFEVRGDILTAMHQYRDAVEAYSRSLEVGGDRANIFAKLGDLYLFNSSVEDKQDKARAFFSHAASLTDDPEEKRELKVKAEALN